ncbi:hypothetical protein BC830DRAFT_1158304 [Chytriomyces sp. MP71]|nr:hypothetical protein BC830DRAFT_1158304 [Chytriomyces sp. MP71]
MADYYSKNPPVPYEVLNENVFSFTVDIANDVIGTPLLIVNLKHWKKEWIVDVSKGVIDENELRRFQWALFWLMNKALQVPAVRKQGLTLLSNTVDVDPTLSVHNIHVMLVEFILNVIPVKLKTLIISLAQPKTYISAAWAYVSPSSNLLHSLGVEIIECNPRTLVSYVDPFSLPQEMDGRLRYNHSDWYRRQLHVLQKSPAAPTSQPRSVTSTPPITSPSTPKPSTPVTSAAKKPVAPPAPVTPKSNPPATPKSTSPAGPIAAKAAEPPAGPSRSHVAPDPSAIRAAILEDYRDRLLLHVTVAGKPMDELEAAMARSEALEDARVRLGSFGERTDAGEAALRALEGDLALAEAESERTFYDSVFYNVVQEVNKAKRRWEGEIGDGGIQSVRQLRREADKLLDEIRPQDMPEEKWRLVVQTVNRDLEGLFALLS